MPLVRIALKLLLHQHRQTIEALAHIGVAGRQPNPRTRWHRDHRRRLFFARALSSADTVAASTAPVMRIRPPVANSISTVPRCSDVDVGDGGQGAELLETRGRDGLSDRVIEASYSASRSFLTASS